MECRTRKPSLGNVQETPWEDVAVYWPNQPEPTRRRHNHDVEATEFFKNFDNKLVNNPYKIAFGQDDQLHRRHLEGQ